MKAYVISNKKDSNGCNLLINKLKDEILLRNKDLDYDKYIMLREEIERVKDRANDIYIFQPDFILVRSKDYMKNTDYLILKSNLSEAILKKFSDEEKKGKKFSFLELDDDLIYSLDFFSDKDETKICEILNEIFENEV